jgi:hypothetical protein
MTDETPDVTAVFTEVLEGITIALYAQNKKTTMKDVAAAVLTDLGKRGIGLYPVDGAKVEHAKAIEECREYLARSKSEHVRVGAQSAMAYAAQGILAALILQQESQFDTPCDCFAGMPDMAPVLLQEKESDEPNMGIWGGGGAKG